MRPATLEEFSRDPVGRYVAGGTWAHFCIHPKLWGMMLWGRPTEADAVQLGRSLVLELVEPAVPHASLVDASRLEAGDEGGFEALQRYVEKRWDELKRSVLRLAMVRPKGLLGAVVAGAWEVMPRPYPVDVFADPRKACEWLKVEEAGRPAAIARQLGEIYANASSTTPLLAALRAHLDQHLDGLRLAEAAVALEVSERTLQRRLAEDGTNFQRELTDARVRAARRLLVERDAKLSTIAVEAGFASLQQLNTVFKRRTGMSPRQWRTENGR
jgi:AraC-like DNA-binding protein